MELDWWQLFINNLVTNSNLSPKMIFILFSILAHSGTFWILNILLYFCYKYKLLMKYRIQGDLLPDYSLIKECLIHNIISHFIIQPIGLYYAYESFLKYDMNIFRPIPSVLIILRDLLIYIAINDTLFYWGHRLLHHKSIYKYIHKKHHRFNVNVGICSEFAHPVEDILANMLPTLLGAFIMHSHPFTLWIWLIIRISETIDAHSGYYFPCSPFKLFSFQGGAERHDFHHSHNVGCYGSFTIFWDHICNTDQAFLDFKKNQLKDKDNKNNMKNE